MKQHLDSSFLARKNQQEQKEVIQKLISDIAHQTLTPISNLKIYGEILSETNHENQEEIATILEQTENPVGGMKQLYSSSPESTTQQLSRM